MRTITEKDKRGLLLAVRAFLRAVNGERISQQAGMPVLEKALACGLTFDEILNVGNWKRAVATLGGTPLMFATYIDILCDGKIEVRELKQEPQWYDPACGFAIIAEAAHDFFGAVTGKGGRYNIPSALTNLAKAIRSHSLQAILSETLMESVMKSTQDDMTYFNYIEAVAGDFNTLGIDDEPTKEQIDRKAGNYQAPEENDPSMEETVSEAPEDEPYPDEVEDEHEAGNGIESVIMTQNNPNDIKKRCVYTVLQGYTPNELLRLVALIEGGMDLTLEELVTKLSNGQFDPKEEDQETRGVHQSINNDLMLSFIDCVRLQGRQMNEEIAAQCDILHDSWDLRTPEVRKMHKLLRLIYTEGKEDPDLLDAVSDIEQMYAEK